MIFEHFYSSKKRRGALNDEFLARINGPFICLSAAILCHSLRCWQSGIFVDEINFTRSNSRGKDQKHSLYTGNNQANGKIGLLERQLRTWANTPAQFQALIVQRITSILEERIARGRKTRIESTVGYADNLDALRREFGINPVEAGSQSISVRGARTRSGDSQQELQEEERDPLAGLIDPALVGTPAGSSSHVDESDPAEDEENEYLSSI